MVSSQSKGRSPRRAAVIGLATAIVVLGACPAPADAHGPIAPVASSYFAEVLQIPAGIEAKVVDGDLRMWLHVPADGTVVVLDYRGAPYLRFSSAGVAVNHNSAMYYLNQSPFAQTPPANLTARTPPSWHRVSDGHAYEWHDGRLHALASVALTIAGLGLELHGRPTVSVFHLVELGFILAFVAWGLWRALLHGPGYFAAFLIAVGAIWAGGVLAPTLLHGFVLIALPAFLARAVTVICMASGAGLLLLVFRLLDHEDRDSEPSATPEAVEREHGDIETMA